jgi:hypothetical protein
MLEHGFCIVRWRREGSTAEPCRLAKVAPARQRDDRASAR